MPNDFPLLLSSLEIRGARLRNRVVSTAHGTYMSAQGLPTERIARYHEARAKGGAGLIICEAASVHLSGVGAGRYATAHTDACIEPYRHVVANIRRHGATAFGQLYHPGRGDIAGSSNDGSIAVAYAPSAVACERNQLRPRAMPATMVADVIDGYAAAAARMTKAGFQGIEVMAHHGHLISQFLNPRINRRGDDYGGSFESRCRFLLEILQAVRARIHDEMPIGVRICASEMDEVGLTETEVLSVCSWLEHTGLVDYLSINLGSTSSFRGGMHVAASMAAEPGYIGDYAGVIRKAVSLPVLATGRINTPAVAESILAAGQADLCGMTRAQICDPELGNKTRSGQAASVRLCIACNQACIGHAAKGAAISCIQFPESGREASYAIRPESLVRKRVLVAGGGPAGLKAAAVAAQRGHEVTLLEAGEHFGGQTRLAALLPGREEFAVLATNLEREARHAGAKLVTNTLVTRALVEQHAPDVIIIATGGRDHERPAQQGSTCQIRTAMEVVMSDEDLGRRTVVADAKLDWTAIGVALKLAAAGRSVRLAVAGDVAGQNIPQGVRSYCLGELHKHNVEVLTHLSFKACVARDVHFLHMMSGTDVVCEDTDTLIVADGAEQNIELEHELSGFGGVQFLAGDCLAPRTAEEAVLEGLRAGLFEAATS